MSSVYRVLGAKEIVRRCPLFRLSGEPIAKLFRIREATMEKAVRTGSRAMIEDMNRTCEACINARRCYHDPNLKAGEKDAENVYRRAQRAAR